jgi:hypothetical protein
MSHLISREEAKRQGRKRFYTGKPCKHGHISERYTKSNSCAECVKSRLLKARQNSKHLTIQEAQSLFKYCRDTGKMWRIKNDGDLSLVTQITGDGYIEAKANYKSYLVHRLAFMMQGIDPSGYQVDHIDGNRANNKWSNLRLVTSAGNNKNRAMPRANTSGVVGVHNQEGRWIAQISIDGRATYLGSFELKEEAAFIRKKAEIKYGFHKNHGRPLITEAL